MATNAIEILIDVLAQEGIDSLDAFVKVLTGAADKTDALVGTVGELDTTLTGLAKSGMSAEAMAGALITALEDAGIQVKDSDGLFAAFTKTLTGVGVAGEKAGAGVDLLNKANEGVIAPADAAADALAREAAAAESLKAATLSAMKGLQVGMVSSAIAQDAAIANLGAGYAKMTSLSEMATPALMKAATWAGIGLAGLAYEGIKQYTQFNKLITQTITQAGVAPSKFGFLSNLAEVVAQRTGQGLADVANTIYRVASGTASWNEGLGATKKQLSDIVTTVSKLNVVGGIAPGAESEQASRVVTALLNANIRGVGHSAVSAAALVNAVVGSGDMRLADLVPGIGRGLLGSAVANNMTAKDALAWVATLTSQGTTASVAGNYVKTGINLLAHPSAQGVQALAMLGIKPGELENLMSGPGGLVAALSTLKAGMKQLNPGNAAKFFYHEAGKVYPGGSGLAGAVAKLQTWSAGELPASFIKAWESGKLNAKQQTEATDLILTKAFGGSKQFATIAAVLNKLGLVKGIEAHINAEYTPGYFNSQYARTAATPAQQFKMMKQSLLVDLVKIGKELTPLGLEFGHIMTGTIGALSKFKGVIIGFVTLAATLLAAAGIGKAAQIGSHLAPLIGAGYNRLGRMAGVDSKFTTAMNERANSGRFKFLNIYGSKKHGILSKLGGESINAGMGISDAEIGAGSATVAGLSKGDNALLSAQARGNGFLADIARNTGVSAGAMGRGGAAGAAEREASGAEGAVGRSTGVMPPLGPRVGGPTGPLSQGSAMDYVIGSKSRMAQIPGKDYHYNPATGRMHDNETNRMLSNAEVSARTEYPYGNPIALGMGGAEEAAAPIALGAGETAVADVAGTGIMSGLGETLGGLAGGPVGMMGMMMAPMLLGAVSPLLGKLGGWLGGLFGGNSKPFVAHIKGAAIDSTQASAKAKKALTALHQFYTETKSKSGKISYHLSGAAVRADQVGYDTALKNYQLATHTYAGSIKNANTISANAINTLYGKRSHLLANDLMLSRKLSGHELPGMRGGMYRVGVGTEEQMHALAMQLPGTAPTDKNPFGTGPRGTILHMMKRNGANWQDFSKTIRKEQSMARSIFADTAGSSAQWQDKHAKLYAALNKGGYFDSTTNLATTMSEIRGKGFLGNKHLTVEEAAKDLPGYIHQLRLKWNEDRRALLNTHDKEARSLLTTQKENANKDAEATEALLKKFQDAAKNQHIAGESVDKLARENAAQIKASGLTADNIGAAVTAALKGYLKGTPIQGTGGGTTRPVPPSAFRPVPIP